jgi:hypothetical protein
MLKVDRAANGHVLFTSSGRIDGGRIAELEALRRSEARIRPIIIDLKNVTLGSLDAVSFLERWEADNVTLANCSGYICVLPWADPPKVGLSPITIYRMKTGRLRVVRKRNPGHNQEETDQGVNHERTRNLDK